MPDQPTSQPVTIAVARVKAPLVADERTMLTATSATATTVRSAHPTTTPASTTSTPRAEPELAAYRAEVETCRALVADLDLDDTYEADNGRVYSLRWITVHMIEEYARHNGHADRLRERIDGVTGD